MEIAGAEPNEGHDAQLTGTNPTEEIKADFRRDLAFPRLTEEMFQRLIPYGREEAFPANAILYTHGDRQIDLFVVLEGGIDISLPVASGEQRFRSPSKA
jgi:thioredoxin reductase (NADPH)